ncbi:MAG: hypothetical protein IPM85_15035 [Chitinophagaceae bacterium]|nr:hypothetical protein [Chitinophagaceae bacterium]
MRKIPTCGCFYSAGALFCHQASYLTNEIQNNQGNELKIKQLEAEVMSLMKDA